MSVLRLPERYISIISKPLLSRKGRDKFPATFYTQPFTTSLRMSIIDTMVEIIYVDNLAFILNLTDSIVG